MKYKIIFKDNIRIEKWKNSTNKKSPKQQKKQNRKNLRHQLKARVILDQVSGDLENISRGGMFILSNNFPEIISNVPIYIQKDKEVIKELRGEVIWISEYDQGKYKIGLQFKQELDEIEMTRVKKRIEASTNN